MLEVKVLRKLYKTGDAVSGGLKTASFTLEPGTFFTLLGPSGCGKTTTLRCIAGLEEPDTGSIRVGPKTLFDSDAGVVVPMNRRNIGMVFQSYAIWPHLTVFENVAFPLRVSKDRKYSRAETQEMVDRALKTVDLGGFQSRPATRLSGGQQQRVALARAIVREPSLLLLDEPLSNLDAALREDMRRELKRLQSRIAITTIYVTHDQAEALDMSDRVAVMHQGEIVQMGAPRDIYFRPDNAFVASFVGATNLASGATLDQARADQISAVRLESGETIRCLFTRPSVSNRKIAISIRPEAIRLAAPDAPAVDGFNRIGGTVSLRGFIGNMNRYVVSTPTKDFQVNTSPELDFAVGEQVVIEFAERNALAIADDSAASA